MNPAPPERGPATPWSPSDLAVAFWPAVFGVALLVWSWWEASGSASLDDQTGWTVLAVVALGINAFGMSSWVRAGRRAVRVRRLEVMAVLATRAGAVEQGAEGLSVSPVLVTYAMSARYHRADCVLVQGKQVRALSGRSKVLRTRTPCEMCEP